MRCSNCKTELGEDDKFCPVCGKRVVPKEGSVGTKPVHKTRPVDGERKVKRDIPERPERVEQREVSYRPEPREMESHRENLNTTKPVSTGITLKTCIMIIVTVTIVCVLGIVTFSVISNIKNRNNGGTGTTPIPTGGTTTPTTLVGGDTEEPPTPVSNTPSDSSYKVRFKGFKFYIPDHLIYENDFENDGIVIGDSYGTWAADCTVVDVSYQMVKRRKSILASSMEEAMSDYGAVVSPATVEEVDGVEFVLMEGDISGSKALLGYAELNSMYSFYFAIENENNDFDREVLKEIATIVSTAEYEEEAFNVETKNGIKEEDMKKVVKAINEAEDDEETEETETSNTTTENTTDNTISDEESTNTEN